MEKYYHFAGIDICIRCPEEWMYTEEHRLAAFQCEKCDGSIIHYFDFKLVEQLTNATGICIYNGGGYRIYQDGERSIRYIGVAQKSISGAYIRIESQGYQHQVEVLSSAIREKIGVHTILSSLETEHLVVEHDGVILHSSYINWNGGGILFTAPSETGKSTQAELWNKFRGAEIINGDRSIIRKTREGINVYGLPFAGSSKYCKNVTLPLKAIVYLGQAPVTSIRKLRGFEAFGKVWEGCTVNVWNKEDLGKAFNLVKSIIEQVPVFYLNCTPDISAVEALESMLR